MDEPDVNLRDPASLSRAELLALLSSLHKEHRRLKEALEGKIREWQESATSNEFLVASAGEDGLKTLLITAKIYRWFANDLAECLAKAQPPAAALLPRWLPNVELFNDVREFLEMVAADAGNLQWRKRKSLELLGKLNTQPLARGDTLDSPLVSSPPHRPLGDK